MNTSWKRVWKAVGCLIAAVGLATPASPADYAARDVLNRRSLSDGIGKPEIPLLMRMRGPGARAIADKFKRRFGATGPITLAGDIKTEVARDHIALIGKDWILKVNADGTSVRYTNFAAFEAKFRLAKPVAERLTQGRLAELGRQAIGEQLADFVKVGTGEELVPFFSQFQTQFGADLEATTPPVEQVLANIVVFSRTVEGVMIVGPGSKIALTFANDGTLLAFDFDWPNYEKAGRVQKLLGVAEVKSRGKGILSFDIESPDVRITRFECGYLDAGIKARDPAGLVQGACFVHSEESKLVDRAANAANAQSGRLKIAVAEAIPAGVSVEPDKAWPQALKVLKLPLPVPGARMKGAARKARQGAGPERP